MSDKLNWRPPLPLHPPRELVEAIEKAEHPTAPAWTPEREEAAHEQVRVHRLHGNPRDVENLAAALAEVERLRHKNRYLAKFGSRIAELEQALRAWVAWCEADDYAGDQPLRGIVPLWESSRALLAGTARVEQALRDLDVASNDVYVPPSAETKPREPGCTCFWEEGDSPCPVHPSGDAADRVTLTDKGRAALRKGPSNDRALRELLRALDVPPGWTWDQAIEAVEMIRVSVLAISPQPPPRPADDREVPPGPVHGKEEGE